MKHFFSRISPPKWLSIILGVLITSIPVWATTIPMGTETPNSLPSPAFIQALENDPLGPFYTIQWYCPDGSVRAARDPCNRPNSFQHGTLKPELVSLAKNSHIFLGQILAGVPFESLLDRENHYSRLKQYQIEKYLEATNEGWILRRAQFLRGAFQAEDEESWGQAFLEWMLTQTPRSGSPDFFLARQWVRSIPHGRSGPTATAIRNLSTQIAAIEPQFESIRSKIHNQPQRSDLDLVNGFIVRYPNTNVRAKEYLRQLSATMQVFYGENSLIELNRYRQNLGGLPDIESQLSKLIETMHSGSAEESCRQIADLMLNIRLDFEQYPLGRTRVTLLDLSLALEEVLMQKNVEVQAKTLHESIVQSEYLVKSAVGAGFLEIWEWENISEKLSTYSNKKMLSVQDLESCAATYRNITQWATSMVPATYRPTVEKFEMFETKATGFTDHVIRSSILRELGRTTGILGQQVPKIIGSRNQIFTLKNPEGFQGINPGVALGKLVVVPANQLPKEWDKTAIYVLEHPPADLKPVAGLLTLSDGNIVSHVELLARNLGIPNCTLTSGDFEMLKSFDGQIIFYAVSPKGTVLLKHEKNRTATEKLLMIKEELRPRNRIQIPTGRLNLDLNQLPNLYTLHANDAGRICGPKAANLGELHHQFPGSVAPGFVIPFAVFKQHMLQIMPGQKISYWDFVQQTFQEAEKLRKSGLSDSEVDRYVLDRLATLRTAIQQMSLLPSFKQSFRDAFVESFSLLPGEVPVFVRSDTNMEDLKDFTGAGLNLTVPNVVSEGQIFQAIRNVWASPYSERSYQWRQRFIRNPWDIYPSIVVLKSIPNQKSGVMITTGIQSGEGTEITVVFNRGVGGAVDGQSGESWVIGKRNATLISPAREPQFSTLPSTGGFSKIPSQFDTPILSPKNIQQLRTLRNQIYGKLGKYSAGHVFEKPQRAVYDVELGFIDDHLWLFQIRPYVENKARQKSYYLQSLDSSSPTTQLINAERRIRQ